MAIVTLLAKKREVEREKEQAKAREQAQQKPAQTFIPVRRTENLTFGFEEAF